MKNNKSKMSCRQEFALCRSGVSKAENVGLTPNLRNKQGFTLIELLVVVLIIGILAAVAVPQYQKAVEKSRTVEALTLLKSLYEDQQLCMLEYGQEAQECTDGGRGGLPEHLTVQLPDEIKFSRCTGDACIKTKDWEYTFYDEGLIEARRYPTATSGYVFQVSKDGSIGCYIDGTIDYCRMVGFTEADRYGMLFRP